MPVNARSLADGWTRRPPAGPRPIAALAAAVLCAALLGLAPARMAVAQSCWTGGALHLDFGAVTPAGHTDAQSSGLSYTCQNGTQDTAYLRVCVFANPGQWGTVAPRRMFNYSSPAYMSYDLYADPARTQVLGPLGGGFPVHSWTDQVAPGTSVTRSIPVYGRVPAGQNLPAGGYQEQGVNGIVRFRQSAIAPPPASDCLVAGGANVGFSSSGVVASFANACTIVASTVMDFGYVASLATARTATSSIQLRCPVNAAWRVGLGAGSHAAGPVRRMAGPGGHLAYELYQDPGHGLVWDNAQGADQGGTGTGQAQTLTVHGRVPPQPEAMPGTYSDTVTVTLTY